MKDIKAVHKCYLATDALLREKESSILSLRSPKLRAEWSQRRRINDQAYFAMIFAQFEDFINASCLKVIKKRKGYRRWGDRRAWDIINSDITSVGFMNRVALLAEKGKTDYNNVYDLYQKRNEIAHGQSPSGIYVTTFKEDLLRIGRSIKARF